MMLTLRAYYIVALTKLFLRIFNKIQPFLIHACRVSFRLKSDTDLFEIVKCKTTVSTLEVIYAARRTFEAF